MTITVHCLQQNYFLTVDPTALNKSFILFLPYKCGYERASNILNKQLKQEESMKDIYLKQFLSEFKSSIMLQISIFIMRILVCPHLPCHTECVGASIELLYTLNRIHIQNVLEQIEGLSPDLLVSVSLLPKNSWTETYEYINIAISFLTVFMQDHISILFTDSMISTKMNLVKSVIINYYVLKLLFLHLTCELSQLANSKLALHS